MLLALTSFALHTRRCVTDNAGAIRRYARMLSATCQGGLCPGLCFATNTRDRRTSPTFGPCLLPNLGLQPGCLYGPSLGRRIV